MNQDVNTPGFIRIGQVKRSHGLDGEIIIEFDEELAAELDEIDLELVYLRNERGDFYPARISSLQPEGKKSYHSFFVQFEHIADRNSADRLRNRDIYLEGHIATDILNQKETEENELLDKEVFDEENNPVGLVTDVMDNPAHPILVVATTSGSLLIPYVDHYIKEVSEQNIYCRNLDHLEGF